MSVIGGQNPIVQDGLVYILDFGNERSYISGSNSAQSLIYNPVPASFVAPPAGDYSGLAAAYSVRRVVSSYSGPAMEVQSGSVSASIGFDSLGNLDTASLEAFAGSGDAFVKTWYDQSGNGNHALQDTTASQPKIVNAGSVVLENGKPALDFDGSNDSLASSLNNFTSTLSLFAVCRADVGTNAPIVGNLGDANFGTTIGNVNSAFRIQNTVDNSQNYATSMILNNQTLQTVIRNSANVWDWYESATSKGQKTLSGNMNLKVIGARLGASVQIFMNGNFNEILLYNTDQSSNRTIIESDINSYYNIFTPVFDPTPGFDSDEVEFEPGTSLDTNQSFPGFSYDQGNLTLIFTGETKTTSTLFSQDGTVSVVSTTSSIGYGSPTNNIGRTFPASGFDHISLRFTTGSVDCFVNGIPTAPNSIFPTGSIVGGGKLTIPNYSGSLGNLLVYNRELTDDEIYAIYLQQARRYGLIEQPKPYTVDSSVYTYTQAAGITGSAVITALDAFVSGLKANNLWNKMIAIYPFLGADTTKNRYNLKDPSLNTTAITYSGSWSASDSGSYNNNTSSYGILENIKGDYYHPLISSESIHLSYLSYDTPASGGYLMGVEELPGLPGDIAAPAAAYSVRKVRTAYTGSAMEVRRDFDDLTFDVGFDGAGNLDTGSLLTNMTASLNTPTLPGDYSGLAAAYSLRKVSSSYSGYAVEVRRAVDNYSASIGFDGSGNLNTASLASFIRTGSETPIDAYSGLAAAYSLRKVVPTYGGDAIEIQSGSVSQSIGFDSFGDLDVAAIKSFAGSGDAFVKTWYDQSGNGLHATQSVDANQPQIVSSGSVILDNGKPILKFGGVARLFTNVTLSQPFTTFIAATTGTGPIYDRSVDPRSYLYFENTRTILFSGITLNGPSPGVTKGVLSAIHNGTNSEYYINNVLNLSGNAGTNGIGKLLIASNGGSVYFSGNIHEITVYQSDQSANRTYIENNINSYYGIYTPDSISTENAYVKTWYDQSGNGNHATQSVDASQPQIVSSGVIVTENGKPALSFDGSNSKLTMIGLHGQSVLDQYFVTSTSDNRYIYPNETAGGTEYGYLADLGSATGGITSNYGSPSLYSNGTLFTGSTRGEVYDILNGYKIVVHQSASTAIWTEYNFSNYTGYTYSGKLQELIAFTSSVSASRNLIIDNINGYYNIFTHTLESGSGYVSKWYDQSGNDRHAAQLVAANQPLILSSGSVILDNGNPAIQFDGIDDVIVGPVTVSTDPLTIVDVFRSTIAEGNRRALHLGKPDGNTNSIYLSNDFQFLNKKQAGYRHPENASVSDGAPDLNQSLYFYTRNSPTLQQLTVNSGTIYDRTNTTTTFTSEVVTIGASSTVAANALQGTQQEILIYTSSQANNRQPIEQNINSYFNIYTPPGYNLNTNSLSLFSSPTTVLGAANNVASASFTTGGPLGLITVTRTGSSDYTLWKNRVPNKVTLPASTPQSNELYLNAANVSNTLFSGSQNNISFASVGAGLTDDEVYTYYELVDDLQTNLNRGVQDPNAFITVWDTRITGTGTVTNTSSIALPLYGTQAITASWGDGTESYISQSTQVDRTHSYAEPGIYTVSITGQGQGFQFNNGGDRAKIMDIVQWGSISGSTTSGFSGCFNLVGTAADPHVLQTTNINDYFLNATKFNGYINNWDVSKVTSLYQTFAYSLTSFNQPLDNWDTSNVTSMDITFAGANKFNQNIGSWNTGNVNSFRTMFGNASAFNNGESPSINNWNTSKATNMYQMFSGASRFNQPIGSWDTSNVTNMAYMFENSPFNQNIGSWNVEKVSTAQGMYQMFYNATAFNNGGSPDINNWRPVSCSNFGFMFQNALAFNQPIGNWTIGTGSQIPVTGINMSGMFYNADAFNQNIGAWDVSKVTNMSSMFQNNGGFNNSGSSDINNWRPISCSNFSDMFNSATAFNQPIGNWPLSASNINMSGMFRQSNFNQNIGSWDVSRVNNMSYMFYLNNDFNNSGSSDINNWDVSNVTTFLEMFSGGTVFNQPIGNWQINTSSAVSMDRMFDGNAGTPQFNQPIGSWDTSRVTNMNNMFRSNTVFNQDIGTWNVGNVTTFGTNFMSGKNATNYSYLHTIYDGWINNKLQPNLTLNFGTANYSASAAEGKALLERPYVTQSIVNIQDSSSFINIITQDAHNLTPNNKVFIFGVSGSISGSVNGLRTVLSTGSATEFTLSGSVFNPADIYDPNTGTVITGYGWNITDGNPV